MAQPPDYRNFTVIGLDPPFTTNFGWAVISVKDGIGTRQDSGIHTLPADNVERLIAIQDFLLDLMERYPDTIACCFERSVGKGFAVLREALSETTGVIKLICANNEIEGCALHTGTMAKVFTGSGAAAGKKNRTKQIARDLFFPGQTFKQIAPAEPPKKGERFEHEADGLGFAVAYVVAHEAEVVGEGGKITPSGIFMKESE